MKTRPQTGMMHIIKVYDVSQQMTKTPVSIGNFDFLVSRETGLVALLPTQKPVETVVDRLVLMAFGRER